MERPYLTAGYDVSSPTTVPQLSPYDSYRTLGAFISPSGGMHKAYEVLHAHCRDYATRLQSSTLNKEEALWSFLLYLLLKLTFPLIAYTLTETQCHQVRLVALCSLLPKLHLNRNTARSIIHGPLLYGGMNILHLYTSQSLGQLKFQMGHLTAQDKTCKLILISHGYLQILVGTTTNFLNLPYDRYHSWACPSWLTSVWQFMSGIGLTLNVTQAWLPQIPSASRTHHIGLKYHHFRSYVMNGNLLIRWIDTKHQLADIYTKPLAAASFVPFCVSILGW